MDKQTADPSKVAVLVPVFNEADRIGPFLDRLKKQGLPVLVVDDGSADRSAEIAERKDVDVLRVGENRGKGNALRAGFRRLLEAGFDWVVIMDGDGQHLPEEMPLFLRKAREGRWAVINGNRLENPRGMPLVRLWTNWFMSFVVSLFAGQRVLDSQCGYKMISAEALKALHLECDRFEIEDEILLEAAKKKFKITSVGVTSVYDGQASHIHPVRDTVRYIKFIFTWVAKHLKTTL